MTDDQADKIAAELATHMAKIAKLFNELGLTKPIGFAVLLCYAGLVLKEMVPELDLHRDCLHFQLEKEAGWIAAQAVAHSGPETIVSCLMALAVSVPQTIVEVRMMIEADRVCGARANED